MEITIVSSQIALAEDFQNEQTKAASHRELPAPLTVTSVTRLPGASGGWFEIVLELAVVGIPSTVVAETIAKAIWAKVSKEKSRGETTLRLIVRDGTRVKELEMKTREPTIEAAIAKLLRHDGED